MQLHTMESFSKDIRAILQELNQAERQADDLISVVKLFIWYWNPFLLIFTIIFQYISMERFCVKFIQMWPFLTVQTVHYFIPFKCTSMIVLTYKLTKLKLNRISEFMKMLNDLKNINEWTKLDILYRYSSHKKLKIRKTDCTWGIYLISIK